MSAFSFMIEKGKKKELAHNMEVIVYFNIHSLSVATLSNFLALLKLR